MKKKINKCIQKKQLVKVYIQDKKGFALAHFDGFIIAQSKTLLLMCDFADFALDGFIILRKEDVYEIKYSQNEAFYEKILIAEKIKASVLKKGKNINIQLNSFQEIFKQLKGIQNAIIIECNYGKKHRFIIGKVEKIKKKIAKILYFNAVGEYDFKPTRVAYDDITFIRVNSPYALIFQKYAKTIQ
jgi:hypothetical protein